MMLVALGRGRLKQDENPAVAPTCVVFIHSGAVWINTSQTVRRKRSVSERGEENEKKGGGN